MTGPTLDFSISAFQTDRSLRIACTIKHTSDVAIYVQNQYGLPYDFRLGEVGGGRSPNLASSHSVPPSGRGSDEGRVGPGEDSAPRRPKSPSESSRGQSGRFTTSAACFWPEGEGTLLVFQGEVGCPTKPFDRRWPQPAYSKLPKGETAFEIRSGLPVRQWENNLARAGEGPRLEIKRLRVCLEILLGPLAVEEIQGVYACDYGQPAYVEEVIELETPIQLITDSSLPKRAEEKRRMLQSYVRLGRSLQSVSAEKWG